MKEDCHDNEKIFTEAEDYHARSGCAAIAATLGFIALFWIIVGAIALFT